VSRTPRVALTSGQSISLVRDRSEAGSLELEAGRRTGTGGRCLGRIFSGAAIFTLSRGSTAQARRPGEGIEPLDAALILRSDVNLLY
jgi:hypothetical protein